MAYKLPRLIQCLKSMRYRVKANKYYSHVSICDEWLNNAQSFYDWANANGYDDTLTLDRIDSDGNYEPSNCRWVTKHEQTQNRKKRSDSIAQQCRESGVNYRTYRQRINRGMSHEEALQKPSRSKD